MAICCADVILTLPVGDGVINNLSYDAVTSILTITNTLGEVYNVVITHSTLVDNGDGTFTHTDAEGTITIVDYNNSVVTDNLDRTYTHDDGSGNQQIIINSASHYNDETGAAAPLAPGAPTTVPLELQNDDTLIEVFDDAALLWSFDGGWTLEASIPICCPDPVEEMAAGNFANPDNPLDTEVATYITNNGPFNAGTLFTLVGSGTSEEPDWSWYYDGTDATQIENPTTIDVNGGVAPVGNPQNHLIAEDCTEVNPCLEIWTCNNWQTLRIDPPLFDQTNLFNGGTTVINPVDQAVNETGTLSVTNPSCYDRVLQVSFDWGPVGLLLRTQNITEPGEQLFDVAEYSIDGGANWINTFWTRGWSEFEPQIDPGFTGIVEIGEVWSTQNLTRYFNLAAGATMDLAIRTRIRVTTQANTIATNWTHREDNIAAVLLA